jgi:AcrR family transcriptional regulator
MPAAELDVVREPSVMGEPAQDLPLLGEDVCERADAARNRMRILAAAEQLIAQEGVSQVSMEAIAAAAGVGKGTLFRRFGDRAGLMHALLDERERDFQDELIRGEPPLGPGAPPVERLVAFGRRLFEYLEAHGDLLRAAESGGRGARFNAAVYAFQRAHVAALVREADPSADTDYLADVLLAPCGADFFLYQRRVRGLPLERIADGHEELVRRLLGS